MTHLHDNEYLFKQSSHKHDIKTTLLNVINDDTLIIFNIDNYDDMKNCIMCVHNVYFGQKFGLYRDCCNDCLHHIVVKMGTLLPIIPYNIIYKHINYWILVSNDAFRKNFTDVSSIKNNEFQSLFVNIPHKLIYTFYHTTSIIFLLSMCDNKSSLYTLGIDIIKYILRFIY